MEAVIAGWVAGYAMAVVTTFALTFLAWRASNSPAFERWISREVSPALVAVPVSLGAVLGWTIVGLVLGSIYSVGDMASQRGALGSPSAPFTLAMAILGALPLLPLIALWSRYWWLWAGLSLCFAGLFGWLMPVLASR